MPDHVWTDVLKSAVGTMFGIWQSVFLLVLAAATKTFFEVKKLRSDMDAAFRKIRLLERERHHGCKEAVEE